MKLFFVRQEGSIIIEGCKFSDETVAVRWLTSTASTVLWNVIDDFLAVSVTAHPDRELFWVEAPERIRRHRP